MSRVDRLAALESLVTWSDDGTPGLSMSRLRLRNSDERREQVDARVVQDFLRPPAARDAELVAAHDARVSEMLREGKTPGPEPIDISTMRSRNQPGPVQTVCRVEPRRKPMCEPTLADALARIAALEAAAKVAT